MSGTVVLQTTLHLLLIFGSTFLAVFTLGLQSLNVNQGERGLARLTSLAISTGHICLYKFMPDSGLIEFVAYYAGGICGIDASMSVHPRIKEWLTRRREARLRAIAGSGRPDEHSQLHLNDTH